MEDTRKKLNYILKSLAFIGYFDSPIKRKLYAVTLCTFISLIFTGEIIGYMNYGTTSARMEISFNVYAFMGFPLYMNAGIRSQQYRLLQCLSNIVREQGNKSDNLRVKAFRLAVDKARVILPKLMIIILLCTIPAIFGWCFTPLLDEFSYPNKNFQSLPYFYQCGEKGDNLLPFNFTCSNRETIHDFIFFNSLCTVFFLWCFTWILWPFFLTVCICIFAEANITVLKEELERSVRDSRFKPTSNQENDQATKVTNESVVYEWEMNVSLRNDLKTIIQYHQYIHGFLETIVPFLQVISNSVLTLCIVSTATTFQLMLKNDEKLPGFFFFQAKMAGALVGSLTFLFTCSYCGQLISEMQTEIGFAVYSIPWYTQDVAFQKELLGLLSLLEKPIKLKSYGMYLVNMNLFARVLRTSYNVLNVMRARLR